MDISDIVAACGLITTDTSTGTGYLIGSNQVATCAHVVKDVPEGGEITIRFSEIERKASVGPLVDRISDCAILDLPEPVPGAKPFRLGGPCGWKAPWDGYGFPAAGRGAGLTLEGVVSNPLAFDDKKAPVLELKSPDLAAGMATALHGYSGSPVIVQGAVIGHLKRFIPDPEYPERPAYGKVYATRAESILKLLGLGLPEPILAPKPGSSAAEVAAGRFREVFQKWPDDAMPNGYAALLQAECLIQVGHPNDALRILAQTSQGVRANQLRALALAKTQEPANIEKAVEILKQLRKAGHLDEETGGILAGRYKQKWLNTGNKRLLLESFRIYLDTFKRTKDTYPGINAAAMALQLGKRADSKRLAKRILKELEPLSPDKLDHWKLATMGEAHLLLGNLNSARTFYQRAINNRPDARENIETMRSQARRNLKALALPEGVLDDTFPEP